MPTLIGPFTQIITLRNLPLKGALADEQLEIITDGGVIVDGATILSVGSYDVLKKRAAEVGAELVEIEGEQVLLPGLVDAHTHICFGGSRAGDFAARNAGKSYLEIAKAGGGIWSTVTHTRAASQADLTDLTLWRLDRQLGNGVTTCEVKSGYGLSVSEELKMLRAIQAAGEEHPVSVVPTCLAAHIKPKDFDGDETAYLNEMLAQLLPVVQAEKLTNRFDVFVEDSAFSVAAARPYLQALQAAGMDITIHGDQFTCGGSALAIELSARSVDHLEVSGEKEILALAESEVVAVALPGASIGIGCAFTPARKLLDAGACLAIASDWNPGSAPQGDLVTQASILATFEKLSTAEVWAAMTFRAAHALGLDDRGKIIPGQRADLVGYPTGDYREVLYQQGSLRPAMIIVGGQLFTA